jgi:hypothetical protein
LPVTDIALTIFPKIIRDEAASRNLFTLWSLLLQNEKNPFRYVQNTSPQGSAAPGQGGAQAQTQAPPQQLQQQQQRYSSDSQNARQNLAKIEAQIKERQTGVFISYFLLNLEILV